MLPPEQRDAAYLWEMREAGRDAAEISGPLTFERLRGEKIYQLALVKALELMGEAANRVSPGFRDAHPEIPRTKIVGLRHRLVHDALVPPPPGDEA